MSWKNTRIDSHAAPATSLISLTGTRLVLAALVSFVIFALIFIVENANEAYVSRWYGKVEIQGLARNIKKNDDGTLSLVRSRDFAHYWAADQTAYAFRIWSNTGELIDGANHHVIASVSPVAMDAGPKPDFWQRKIGQEWFETLSGQRVRVGDQSVWIEVATWGDPNKLRYGALFTDFMEDVVTPVVPTFLFAIALSLFSLHHALLPVKTASAAVRFLDPADPNSRLQIAESRLPHEVAVLANAVNNLLKRTNELLKSQSEFIGRAAHQLRTPLAVMLLEAEKIDDPRVKRLQVDIIQLGETVDRLLDLARMQGAATFDCSALDLFRLAEDVVNDLSSLTEKYGCKVSLLDHGSMPVRGDYVTLREALRNLITNAIVHHPSQATVHVRCGPGARISVEDDGHGISEDFADKIFEPFSRANASTEGAGLGLAVVQKVVELHCGSITVTRSELGGAAFIVDLIHDVRAAHDDSGEGAPDERREGET